MRALILAIALALLTCLPCWAADVLIVQGARDKVFTEAVQGFKASVDAATRTLVMADYAEFDLVRLVREERPRLVLAVGDSALAAAKRLRQVPVVSVMALSAGSGRTVPNMAGVSMFIAPDKYLDLMGTLQLKRVGVLYNPDKTGEYIERAQQAARHQGIELVARVVRSPKEVPAQLETLRGKVAGLWLVPDSTALASEVSAAYFLFAQAERLPVIAFADYYLRLGAVAVLELDCTSQGRQAAELAKRILAGTGTEDIGIVQPRYFSLHGNTAVGKKLGLAADALDKPGSSRRE
jgi:putative ABC transport system substrate-binding protein